MIHENTSAILVAMLAISGMAVGLANPAAGSGRPFVQLECSLHRDPQGDRAWLEVHAATPLDASISGAPMQSVEAVCPIFGPEYWVATFRRGDRFEIRIEEVQPATTGWLVFGGEGQRVRITVPQVKPTVTCQCDEGTVRVVDLELQIVDEVGQPLVEIRSDGAAAPWHRRLLPFATGQPAPLPDRVDVRIAWGVGEPEANRHEARR